MKVSYIKNYGNDGTIYNQMITINKEIAEEFNKYILNIKNQINYKKIWSNEDLRISSYAKMLDIHLYTPTINYINLTTLDQFMKFYLKTIYEPPKRDKNYERILNRNTIIKVV